MIVDVPALTGGATGVLGGVYGFSSSLRFHIGNSPVAILFCPAIHLATYLRNNLQLAKTEELTGTIPNSLQGGNSSLRQYPSPSRNWPYARSQPTPSVIDFPPRQNRSGIPVPNGGIPWVTDEYT